MKISYNILKKIIDFDWSVAELAERLTMSGSEVEAIEHKGKDIDGIIAAKITDIGKIEGYDKLSLCKVHDGSETIQVVCGAPNVAIDQIILFAPVGSRIPGMTLKKAKLAGKESFGMILSEAELGLSDTADEIAVLSADIKPGTPLGKIIDYKDTVFELEITPNRPDCLSHVGIAREIQALGGGKLQMPDTNLIEIEKDASDAVKIIIDDPDGCPRYTGRVLGNAAIAPSPLWLKMTVYYLGMRPINNVVDITNYVMLELGQPLHAFDFDLFEKPEVLVRRAKEGEKFVTLDEVERTLNKDHLLITDSARGVAIAGIMGGQFSEVSAKTTNLLLESACFDPVTIRRGSKKLGLSTESSRRFERGADPNMAPLANNRACKMISEITGAEVFRGTVDAYPKPFVPVEIELKPERVNSLLGTGLSLDDMKSILGNLDIEVRGNGNVVAVQPSFRPDLKRNVDITEEIARIYGFDNIPAVYRPGGPLGAEDTKSQRVIVRLKSFLVGAGSIEVFPITLVDSTLTKRLSISESSVKLINPLSEEMAVVRPNMIISMLPVIKRNLNFKEKDLFLFEIGDIYQPSEKSLPTQKERLIIAMTGFEAPVFWGENQRKRDIYSIKGLLEDIADHFGLERVKLSPAAHFAFEQSLSFEVYIGEEMLGYAGQLSKECCLAAEIKSDVYLAELDLDKIIRIIDESSEARDLDRFPSADRDIAIIVDENVKAGDILAEIKSNSNGLAGDVWIFDMYRGKNIPKDKKSLAFGIKYRLRDRTLTDSEVDEAHNRIVAALQGKFNAELRS